MNHYSYAEAANSDGWRHGSCECCPWAVLTGAAIAFGLMGMAEAIRLRPYCPHGTYLGECLDCYEGEDAPCNRSQVCTLPDGHEGPCP